MRQQGKKKWQQTVGYVMGRNKMACWIGYHLYQLEEGICDFIDAFGLTILLLAFVALIIVALID